MSHKLFVRTDVTFSRSNVPADWERSADSITIDGRPLTSYHGKEEREMNVKEVFKDRESTATFFEQVLLRKVPDEGIRKAASQVLIDTLHQGLFLNCASANLSLDLYEEAKGEVGMSQIGQSRKIDIVTTQHGFRLSEAVTVMECFKQDQTGFMEPINPEPGEEFTIFATVGLDFDFRVRIDEGAVWPLVTVFRNEVLFGNSAIEDILDKRNFFTKFLENTLETIDKADLNKNKPPQKGQPPQGTKPS